MTHVGEFIASVGWSLRRMTIDAVRYFRREPWSAAALLLAFLAYEGVLAWATS